MLKKCILRFYFFRFSLIFFLLKRPSSNCKDEEVGDEDEQYFRNEDCKTRTMRRGLQDKDYEKRTLRQRL